MNFFIRTACLYTVTVLLSITFQLSYSSVNSESSDSIQKEELKILNNIKLYDNLVKYWMLNFKDYVHFDEYCDFGYSELSKKYNDKYVNNILLNLYELETKHTVINTQINSTFNCAYAIVTFDICTDNSQSKVRKKTKSKKQKTEGRKKQFVIYHDHDNGKIIEVNNNQELITPYPNISEKNGLNCKLSIFENMLNHSIDINKPKQINILTKHGEFQILKLLYQCKDNFIKNMNVRENNSITMDIKLFTYMDMCPNCWTVWYRCINDLQNLYKNNINCEQLNLDVSVYSMKPYKLDNHMYFSVLNSPQENINTKRGNDIFTCLNYIEIYDIMNVGRRRNRENTNCNNKFSQQVDLDNLKVIGKYYYLLKNNKTKNYKNYKNDSDVILYYYDNIKNTLNNEKQIASKQYINIGKKTLQNSFFTKYLESLFIHIIKANNYNNDVLCIIKDCFEKVIIELFNLHVRNYDKELVENRVKSIIEDTKKLIMPSHINTANGYSFIRNKKIIKNKLQEKQYKIDQKENNGFPQQRKKIQKKKMNDHMYIKEEENRYYNSSYDYDEEDSDNDEYISDSDLYDDDELSK